jgi:hypothetical protein
MAGAIETSRGDRTGVEAIRGDAMALEVADRVGQSLSNLGGTWAELSLANLLATLLRTPLVLKLWDKDSHNSQPIIHN